MGLTWHTTSVEVLTILASATQSEAHENVQNLIIQIVSLYKDEGRNKHEIFGKPIMHKLCNDNNN